MLISCYLITAGMTGYFFALQSYNNMFKNIYIFSIFQRKFVTLQYLSLIHISEPTRPYRSRMPSSA